MVGCRRFASNSFGSYLYKYIYTAAAADTNDREESHLISSAVGSRFGRHHSLFLAVVASLILPLSFSLYSAFDSFLQLHIFLLAPLGGREKKKTARALSLLRSRWSIHAASKFPFARNTSILGNTKYFFELKKSYFFFLPHRIFRPVPSISTSLTSFLPSFFLPFFIPYSDHPIVFHSIRFAFLSCIRIVMRPHTSASHSCASYGISAPRSVRRH